MSLGQVWAEATRLLRVLWWYGQTRRTRFGSREALLQHQDRRLAAFTRRLGARSAYFARFSHLPLAQWPLMDKAAMMSNFDAMNTAGLRLDEVLRTARAAEADRDFTPTLHGCTVGLSSGTSGSRGVFVASPAEIAQWAGIVLAKTLPAGLFAGERVALFLRANSNLYRAVETRWIAFKYFDLLAPFEAHLPVLQAFSASIIVAPAQVLRALALARRAGSCRVDPRLVVSVAEVLEPADRALLESEFGCVKELYQATEGFIAASCERGTLHLNEELLRVEPEWLDRERFVPIVTDFTRFTQPIVRYRLGDVLRVRPEPCECGSPTLALAGVEGRCDDQLVLPGTDGRPVTVFADAISRAIAQALPVTVDYRLTQTAPAQLELQAGLGAQGFAHARAHLDQALARLGVDVRLLVWRHSPEEPRVQWAAKRRRIVRLAAARAAGDVHAAGAFPRAAAT